MTTAARPMASLDLTWQVDQETTIRPFAPGEERHIFAAIQQNREHLDRWLLWSNSVQSESDAAATIAKYVAKQEAGLGFNCGIWVGDRLAGGMVCRELEPKDRWAEIGYWLGASFTGRGLATSASRLATEYLINTRAMHRVFMQCASDNLRSRAVPERLGFTLEGILRESHSLNGAYYDQAVYGMLDREWQAGP